MYGKPSLERYGELRELTQFGFWDFFDDFFRDFHAGHHGGGGHHNTHNTFRS